MELVASVVVRGGWRSLELVAEVDCAKVEVGVCLQSYLCEGCRSTKLVIKVGRAKMVVGVCRQSLVEIVADGGQWVEPLRILEGEIIGES